MTRRTRREIGALGEDLAVAELHCQGMEVVDRNWTCRYGEIDVVAVERAEGRRTAVFCEVKCRTGLGFGDPLESITYAKIKRMRRLAAEWLSQHTLPVDGVRLDAIGVTLFTDREPLLVHVTGIGDA